MIITCIIGAVVISLICVVMYVINESSEEIEDE